MGLILRHFLDDPQVVACRKCRTHLTTPDHLISKLFQGASGRAYLYDWLVNTVDGTECTRQMTTGVHVVRDLVCVYCGTTLGWRYIRAFEEEQRYKEGKMILERSLVTEI